MFDVIDEIVVKKLSIDLLLSSVSYTYISVELTVVAWLNTIFPAEFAEEPLPLKV